MKPKTPSSLEKGHANLHNDLDAVISLGGKLGEKAQQLAKVLYQHFEKEEEFALPPLSFLLMLTEGSWKIDTNAAIVMSEKLESKLSEMTKDHQNINKILEQFLAIAKEENNYKAIQFARDLNIHVEIEDQVLYPTSILIGRYLKNIKNH